MDWTRCRLVVAIESFMKLLSYSGIGTAQQRYTVPNRMTLGQSSTPPVGWNAPLDLSSMLPDFSSIGTDVVIVYGIGILLLFALIGRR